MLAVFSQVEVIGHVVLWVNKCLYRLGQQYGPVTLMNNIAYFDMSIYSINNIYMIQISTWSMVNEI